MAKNDLAEYKKKYQAVRHHAWAGSVLLGVILAIRLLFEISDTHVANIDLLVLILGVVVIIYTMTSLFLTYKYRKGLLADGVVPQIISSADDLEKERLKLEKKKIKAEVKKEKKK